MFLVKFNALKDEKKRSYYKQLPTSFKLSDNQVDELRDAAHRILLQSKEFSRPLSGLEQEAKKEGIRILTE